MTCFARQLAEDFGVPRDVAIELVDRLEAALVVTGASEEEILAALDEWWVKTAREALQ